MDLRRNLLTSFSILLIYSGTAFSAPTDATIADDATTEESHTQNIDIEVYDDEQAVAVAIIDPETLDSVDSGYLYGGTGNPDSTEKPFPFSIYDNVPNDTIVVHLLRNGTSNITATKMFSAEADKLRKDGPNAIDIYSDGYDGIFIVRFINRVPERSIIIELTDRNGNVLSPLTYLYKSNGTEIPIVIPLTYNSPAVLIIVQAYDANTGKIEGQVVFVPDEETDDDDDDDDDDGDEEDEDDDDDDDDEEDEGADGGDKGDGEGR